MALLPGGQAEADPTGLVLCLLRAVWAPAAAGQGGPSIPSWQGLGAGPGLWAPGLEHTLWRFLICLSCTLLVLLGPGGILCPGSCRPVVEVVFRSPRSPSRSSPVPRKADSQEGKFWPAPSPALAFPGPAVGRGLPKHPEPLGQLPMQLGPGGAVHRPVGGWAGGGVEQWPTGRAVGVQGCGVGRSSPQPAPRSAPTATCYAARSWAPSRCGSSCRGCQSCAWASTTRCSSTTRAVSTLARFEAAASLWGPHLCHPWGPGPGLRAGHP